MTGTGALVPAHCSALLALVHLVARGLVQLVHGASAPRRLSDRRWMLGRVELVVRWLADLARSGPITATAPRIQQARSGGSSG